MSDLPVRTESASIPVVATSRAFAARAAQWIDRVGRRAIVGCERAALRSTSRVRAAGPLGWSGLGLLFGALIAGWSVVLPQREGLAGLRDSVSSSQHAGSVRTASPRQGTAEFLGRLPTRREIPALLGVVLAEAQAAGLSLESGHYDWRPGKDGGVGEYRVTLPVHGAYPAIRQFVERTLATAPPVALESLHLSREDVTDSAVGAEVSFVIYVGDHR